MWTRLVAACSPEASSSTSFVAIQHGCKRRKLPNRMPHQLGFAQSYSQSSRTRLAGVTTAPSSSGPASLSGEPFSLHSTQPPSPHLGSVIQSGGIIKLPTPLPADVYSTINEVFYTSSKLQMKLAIIDTCLHNLSDVDRARKVFDLLRTGKDNPAPASIIDTALHNRMLRAYFAKASEPAASNQWRKRASTLYEEMVEGKSLAAPDASTFAIVLHAEAYNENLKAGTAANMSQIFNDVAKARLGDASMSWDAIFTTDDVLDLGDYRDLFLRVKASAEAYGPSNVVQELEAVSARQQKYGVAPPEEVIPVTKAALVNGKTVSPDGSPATEGVVPYKIDALRRNLREIMDMRVEEDMETRQANMERSVYESAAERFRHEAEHLKKLEINTGLRRSNIQSWMWKWHVDLAQRLEVEIANQKEKEKNKNVVSISARSASLPIASFLSCLPVNVLSMITIMEVLALQHSPGVHGGVKITRALKEVGTAVEAEYQARTMRKLQINKTVSPGAPPIPRAGFASLVDRRKRAVEAANPKKTVQPALEWTTLIRTQVGAFLLGKLLDVATISRTTLIDGKEYTEEQPAISRAYDYIRGFKYGVLQLNPELAARLAEDDVRTLVHPRQLPMLIAPRPWVGENSGGYLTGRSSVMRIKESIEQIAYLRHAAARDKLEHVFRALDVLGSTAWVINRDVFEVALQVWNSGEALADIPPKSLPVPIPVRPVDAAVNLKTQARYEEDLQRAAALQRNNHSQRCATNYKMEIARAFLGEKFFFPHNIDFRGRAYPIPPHLSHIGDDLCRGLLKFAEYKPLGVRGLRWLKIHLANLYGNDKVSLDDREQFTENHMGEIYDSATKPLEGNRWWLKADDPWQCLATCIELKAALDSPEPLEFLSNLPVHQDGTCNGLQHYAALGGDETGASQVNLDVTDRPSDVYSHVAQMVEAEILKDIANGNVKLQQLSGKVSRKVVKQTVMTTVYGVTLVGARAQVEKQLRDRGDIPTELCWEYAAYLARKTIGCIGDLFKGANAIQNWLSHAARLIARAIPADRASMTRGDASEEPIPQALEIATLEGTAADDMVDEAEAPQAIARSKMPLTRTQKEQMTSVIWTTPLGLPVIQPYRKVVRKQVMTSVQSVFISDPDRPAQVDPRKQTTAFPPNFIHSLDATHMTLTAVAMSKANMTFASVHDSYWTHACSVDSMSVMIRDTFVELHSQNVLQSLRAEFLERYSGYKIPASLLLSEDIQATISRKDLTDAQKDQILASCDRPKRTRVPLSSPAKLLDGQLFIPTSSRAQRKILENTLEANSEAPLTTADATEQTKDTRRVMHDFIDFGLILPPLPDRGTFDVSRTKKSLYFFS